MGKLIGLIVFTGVQIFVAGAWGQGAVVSTGKSESQLLDEDRRRKKCEDNNKNDRKALERCLIQNQLMTSIPDDQDEKSCQDAYSSYTKAENEFRNKCGTIGFGSNTQCEEKVSDCYDKSGSEEFSTMNAAMTQLGVQGIDQLNKKCPLLTSDKWESSHEKIQNKLESAKKDLTKAKQDVADAQKSYNEKNTNLAKEYNDLNKEQAKAALKAKDDKRQAAAAAQETTRKAEDAIFNNSMKLQDLRQKIANIYLEKAQKLAEGSAAIAKFKCTSDLQDKLKKMGSVTASTFSNMMSSGSTSRNSSQEMYKACISAFLTGRQQQINTYNAQIESINAQIANAEETQKYLQDALKTAQTNSNEMTADLSKADQDAQTDYESRVKEIQTKMQNNYQESTKTLQTLNERQAQLQQDVDRASNKFLSSENGKPEDGATGNYRDAADKFGAVKETGLVAVQKCGNCSDKSPKNPVSSNTRLCNKDGTPNKSFFDKDVSGEGTN